MPNITKNLSRSDALALQEFLQSPKRPKGTLSFHELQGFLFAIASSPETIAPSDWIPQISDDEDIGFANESEAESFFTQIMLVFNEVNAAVLERSDALPRGCDFSASTLANLDEDTPIAQWSRGFMIGHDWLAELWAVHLTEELDQEFGLTVMALSFFSSMKLARAYYDEMEQHKTDAGGLSFEQFAEAMRELFPAMLSEYADLGRTIFEDRWQQAASEPPVRSSKTGRNEPCPCGSGKKFKKCCAKTLH